MKSIQQIQNEVAQSYGYTWDELLYGDLITNVMVIKVATKYAEEALREFERRAIDRGAFTYEDFNNIISLINDLK